MRETTRDARSEGSVVGRLGLPVQVAPIDRTPSGVALASGSGVEPAFWGALASTLIPIAAKQIGKWF